MWCSVRQQWHCITKNYLKFCVAFATHETMQHTLQLALSITAPDSNSFIHDLLSSDQYISSPFPHHWVYVIHSCPPSLPTGSSNRMTSAASFLESHYREQMATGAKTALFLSYPHWPYKMLNLTTSPWLSPPHPPDLFCHISGSEIDTASIFRESEKGGKKSRKSRMDEQKSGWLELAYSQDSPKTF